MICFSLVFIIDCEAREMSKRSKFTGRGGGGGGAFSICTSVGPTVQPAEHKQTHTQTDATENITSSANAGDKNQNWPKICRQLDQDK